MNLLEGSRPAPWYIEALLAIGGWVAGLLAAIAIFVFAGTIVGSVANGAESAAALALIIGIGFAGIGAVIGEPRINDFRRHFAIAAVAAGLTAAAGGFGFLVYRFLDAIGVTRESFSMGGAMLITSASLALFGYFLNRRLADAILTFLTSLAVYGVAIAGLIIVAIDAVAMPRLDLIAAPIVAAGGAFLTIRTDDWRRRAIGAALIVGPLLHLLMLYGAVDFVAGPSAKSSTVFAIIAPKAFLFATIFFALIELRRFHDAAPLLATGALLLAATWVFPNYGGIAIIALLAGLASSHRGLSAIGVIALAWALGRYYYDLSASLLFKSGVMATLGIVTIAGAAFFRTRGKAPQAVILRRSGFLEIGLVGAAIVSAMILVNLNVQRLESAFDQAEVIYLPLGPRDPRSILQGDYMVLTYREEIYPDRAALDELPSDGAILLELDENKVARFSRIADENIKPERNEIRVAYVKDSRGIRYTPRSFFFQEGDAASFQDARFAVVKVAPSGQALLIDLADENRRVIDPQNANHRQ